MFLPARLLKEEHMLDLSNKASHRRSDPVAPNAYTGFLPPRAASRRNKEEPPGRSKTSLMWSKQILEGIRDDDPDFLKLGLKHDIADPQATVSGGKLGAAYNFGLEGFFTEEQVETTTANLKSMARETALHNRVFVYEDQWKANDADFEKIGRYCGPPLLRAAVRGDTALHLALRAGSYRAAAHLADGIVDPFVRNELGEYPTGLLEAELAGLQSALVEVREAKRALEKVRQRRAHNITEKQQACIDQEKEKLIKLAHIPAICEGMAVNYRAKLEGAEVLAEKVKQYTIMRLPIPARDSAALTLVKAQTDQRDICEQMLHRALNLIDRHPGSYPAVPTKAQQLAAAHVAASLALMGRHHGGGRENPAVAPSRAKKDNYNLGVAGQPGGASGQHAGRGGKGGRRRQQRAALVARLLGADFMDEFEAAATRIQLLWRRKHAASTVATTTGVEDESLWESSLEEGAAV